VGVLTTTLFDKKKKEKYKNAECSKPAPTAENEKQQKSKVLDKWLFMI